MTTAPKTALRPFPGAKVELEEFYPDDLDLREAELLGELNDLWFNDWVEEREETEADFWKDWNARNPERRK